MVSDLRSKIYSKLFEIFDSITARAYDFYQWLRKLKFSAIVFNFSYVKELFKTV